MTSDELSFLEEILTFCDEGSVIRGRNSGTDLWVDFYGEYGVKKYVVVDGSGDLVMSTDNLIEAWNKWKACEEI